MTRLKKPEDIIYLMQNWVSKIVVGLNICPFAAPVVEAGLVRYSICSSEKNEEAAKFFLEELDLIQAAKTDELGSSLLIYPHLKNNFRDFLDFCGSLEDMLGELVLNDEFQLVAFHPDFQFVGLEKDDRANWVNRSPYPVVHLLRSADISLAMEDLKGGESISMANEKMLKNLSDKEFAELFAAFVKPNS